MVVYGSRGQVTGTVQCDGTPGDQWWPCAMNGRVEVQPRDGRHAKEATHVFDFSDCSNGVF